MHNPLISVVVPVYNRERTLKRAIESVVNQTYKNLEIIIIDDCSTDCTWDVINALVNTFKKSKISAFKLDSNSGACVARNVGVEHSSGELIAFQDSDDEWLKDKLEKQLKFLVEGDYDFVTCGFSRVIGNKRRSTGLRECPKDRCLLWVELLNCNWISTQTILCKKKCFDKISFDPEIRRFQDWDLGLQAVNYFKIGHLRECLVDVYLQDNSITTTVDKNVAKLVVIKKHKTDIQPENKIMLAQYYKSIGDVLRSYQSWEAGRSYRKSFLARPNGKVFICCILSYLGIMRYYKDRDRS